MRSNFITVATLTLAGLLAAVRADSETYYAIYNATTGDFLHSENAVVQTEQETGGTTAVDANNNKGERWFFRDGAGSNSSFVSTQAHENHITGYDSSKNAFHADFKQSNAGTAVKAYFFGDNQLYMCYNENCIGQGGTMVEGPNDFTTWTYAQVGEA